jgi:hypothetical protein
MHDLPFLPIAILGATVFAAGVVSAWIELFLRPRPAQKFRPVLVHDKGPAPLLRSQIRRPVPRRATPIRLVINGG